MVLSWLEANPRAAHKHGYGAAQRAVIDPDRVPDVGALLGDKHGPTPLYALPALAKRLGVGEIRVKDESQRFGFGAFKALGGVFAVHEYVTAHRGEAPAGLVFTTASSGNHGRASAPSRSARRARSSCPSSPRLRRKRRSAPAAPR